MKIFHRHHFRVVRVLAREGELVRDLGAVHEAVADEAPSMRTKTPKGRTDATTPRRTAPTGGGFGSPPRAPGAPGTAGASLVREAHAGCVRAIATATVVATAVRSTRAPRAVPRGAPRAASRAVPRGTPRARVLATRWRRGLARRGGGERLRLQLLAAPAPRPGRTAAAVAVAVAVAAPSPPSRLRLRLRLRLRPRPRPYPPYASYPRTPRRRRRRRSRIVLWRTKGGHGGDNDISFLGPSHDEISGPP